MILTAAMHKILQGQMQILFKKTLNKRRELITFQIKLKLKFNY